MGSGAFLVAVMSISGKLLVSGMGKRWLPPNLNETYDKDIYATFNCTKTVLWCR